MIGSYADTLSKNVEKLKEECKSLTAKRKGLKRFLDIDSEKKELDKLSRKRVSVEAEISEYRSSLLLKAEKDAEKVAYDSKVSTEKVRVIADACLVESKAALAKAKVANDEANLRFNMAKDALKKLHKDRSEFDISVSLIRGKMEGLSNALSKFKV